MGDFIYTVAINTIFAFVNASIKNPNSDRARALAPKLKALYDNLGILLEKFRSAGIILAD